MKGKEVVMPDGGVLHETSPPQDSGESAWHISYKAEPATLAAMMVEVAETDDHLFRHVVLVMTPGENTILFCLKHISGIEVIADDLERRIESRWSCKPHQNGRVTCQGHSI